MPYLIKKVKDAKTRKITCGIMRNLTSVKDFDGMDFAHVTISNKTRKHYHKNLTECYFVLKGTINVAIDGKVKSLEKGSLIMIKPNTHHQAWKTSKENAEILVVCCPPWLEEDEILSE